MTVSEEEREGDGGGDGRRGVLVFISCGVRPLGLRGHDERVALADGVLPSLGLVWFVQG